MSFARVAFDPAAMDSGFTLSDSNRIASMAGAEALGCVKATLARACAAGGKWYFEFVADGASNRPAFGLVNAAYPVTAYPGEAGGAYGVGFATLSAGAGSKLKNGSVDGAYGSGLDGAAAGKVLQVYCDFSGGAGAGVIRFVYDGADYTAMYSDLTDTLFPAFGGYHVLSGLEDRWRLNCGHKRFEAQCDAAGYQPWDGMCVSPFLEASAAGLPAGYTMTATAGSAGITYGSNPHRLFDDTSGVTGTNTDLQGLQWAPGIGDSASLELELPAEKQVEEYYLRAIDGGAGALVPYSWRLEGSGDGSSWTTLDTQTNVLISDTDQPHFVVASPGKYLFYRLVFTAGDPTPGPVEQVKVNYWRLYGWDGPPASSGSIINVLL